MKTLLLQVGKTVNKHFVAGINDYAERISHYMPFEMVIIPELRNTKNLTEEQQKTAEGELIMKQLQPTDHVVLLDKSVLAQGPSAEVFSSPEFSAVFGYSGDEEEAE